ncbi:MAG: Glycosyl transferase, group 2 family protein [Candidatus Moranbacteria bacterium GW2011_GWF2_34_56]|nr:MAG: Glycosyl transferase, group 2 family protein [Candidatus Moranbacteria bacterium GW2011_GWF1_34_10]KKP63872.1 MAG: Glycosyl transferase, group 2 family protein [Candidatus Moranbacteria bacterium GW2011_GWF2_34_56]HBI17409.1 hypothetical protein [Candidatus Moranbacteria bacterium]
MENKNPYVSVVIPTYNEEMRKDKMKEHLESIGEYFKNKNLNYEILIALDGPKDNTAQLVKEHASKLENIRILDRKENMGKGFTLREGMVQADGDIVIFTDMDGATPIKMFDRFLPKFKDENFDIVIGSRDMAESEVKVHQPFWKEWLGNGGNLLIQMVGGLWGMKDTQCGFKAFTKEATQDILPRTTVNRWGLDFELLMIGKKLGYKITEVPVEWIDSGDSTVGISGYISTFKDLFSVKWNMIKGVYQLDKKVEEMKKA